MDSYDVYTISGDDAKRLVYESPWGIAKVSPEGKFQWLNPAYCEILGCPGSPGLVQGTHYRDWSHPDEVGEDEKLAELVKQGEIPGYVHIKRYRQRGSTPQRERWIWGQLSVWGDWDQDTKKFCGYRVHFQPFTDPPHVELVSWSHLKKAAVWIWENKKTAALILVTLLSVGSALIRGNWQEVLRVLTAEEVDLPAGSTPGQSPSVP